LKSKELGDCIAKQHKILDLRSLKMSANSFSRTTEYTVCGRKRAIPTQSRRPWKIIYAVTLYASVVGTIAFQQSLPLSHHHSPLSIPRSSTAVHVLTDPTNLLQIESKQSVEDRAVLEELYLLSSLAKKATRKKSPVTQKTNRKRKPIISSVVDSKKKISTTKIARKTRSNSIKFSKDAITTASTAATIEDGRTARKTQEQTFLANTESNYSQTQAPNLRQTISSVNTSQSAKPSKKVRFKGLTTVPNRRNQKQKKTLIGPLSERIGIDQDDYIRNLLQKKEEFLSYDSSESSYSTSTTVVGSDSRHADDLATTDSKIVKLKSKPLKMVHNSLSSTMPGFREGKNTFRKKAYSDGIKVAQQNSRIEFVETAVSRKKRVLECGQAMYMTSKSVPDSLVQFANEIHDVDRITPEEEISLGEKTQEALRIQHIYDGLVAKLERDPTDDEWCAASGKFNMEAIAQIVDEGLEAKNRLVTSNLRMVQGVVNVYIRNGLQGQYNAGDLMQEGILALIRAAEKFDPSRGFRFSTYAMYWIRSAIKRDQCSQSRIIQIPQRLHETNKRITVNRKELTEMFNRGPTQVELSKAVGMTVAQIERCEVAISQKMHSLDQNMVNRNNPMKVDEHRDTLYSIIASKSDEGEYNEFDLNNLREDLLRALNLHLTEEESTILILKFGMDDEYASSKKIGRSIAEVGEIIGLKPDKVRRIIKRSLKQLEALIGDEFRSYNRDFCI